MLFVPTTNEAFSQGKRFIDIHVTSKLDGYRQYHHGQEEHPTMLVFKIQKIVILRRMPSTTARLDCTATHQMVVFCVKSVSSGKCSCAPFILQPT